MSLSTQEVIRLNKEYTLFEWNPQGNYIPLPIDHAKGSCFWTTDGKRYLDFNSQLMSVNIGHGDERVNNAIKTQLDKLNFANPYAATEPRGVLGELVAKITPGNLKKSFFTLGGSEANENAIKIAKMVKGGHKILARYRGYHGGTAASMALTGDPRRWAAEPSIPGVHRIPDPYYYRCRLPISEAEFMQECLNQTEDIIKFEGAKNIAAMIMETIVGTNGIIIPSKEYMQGIRYLCDKYGIFLILDEVMCGFGRTGKWFACEHFDVVPDMMTMAKGLTSSYLPLGDCVVSEEIASYFDDHVLYAGLTYGGHAVSCAAAIAAINVMIEDNLVERAAEMGTFLAAEEDKLKSKHPSVGDVRHIGLFTIFELVKNRTTKEPLAPYNASGKEMEVMNMIKKFFNDNGLFTFVRWNSFFVNPPLSISKEELLEGLAIVDQALDIADEFVI
ncbi:MAG: aminotransferase class III-fold pyridoxal phosphate-dependent enzyme [Chloroflexi bacterium]|jgi:taurine--2-oxoglutarate transaminase|nr:aminotransferase class III-fold pyridoxal phosphate-dependent enzyme [Chloroflexota bacterium]